MQGTCPVCGQKAEVVVEVVAALLRVSYQLGPHLLTDGTTPCTGAGKDYPANTDGSIP